MALAANALTLLATLKGELGESSSTYDSRLERYINVASDAIERHCGRSFGRATVTDERVRGYGTQRLMLAVTPVVSVTSVEYADAELDATSYYIESAGAGILFRESGWPNTASYQSAAAPFLRAGTEEASILVTYVGGYILPSAGGTRNLPYDLEEACILTAVNLWRNAGKHNKLREETDAESETDWESSVIPGPAKSILKRYRRWA